MARDYNIFKKILFIFTTINNPFIVLFDKLGLRDNFLYHSYTGTQFIARAKSTDINEGIAILSGKEYPKELLNISSKKNPIIIDAGAHIGMFSLYVKSINPSARIYAIEPLEKNVACVKKNLSLNKIKGVTIIKYALSDKRGEAKLWLSDNKFDIATISLSKKRQQEDSYRMVRTDTIGGLIKSHHIKKIDVFKMDIEGVEYKVLKKDIKLIVRKVEKLLVEYHTDSDKKMREKIITILTRNNFGLIFENRCVLGFLNKISATE